MRKFKWLSLQFVLCVLGYYFIKITNYIFPWYTPWVYKYASKARKTVYNHWINNWEDSHYRLSKFYGYSGPVTGKEIDFKNMALTFELAYNDDKVNKNMAKTKQYYKYGIKIKNAVLADLSYYFYYFFVWMWLDDYNIVNGIDIRLFNRNNKAYENISGKDVMSLVNGTKVYEVVFEQLESKEVVPFSTRYFCCRHITTPNLLRDLGTFNERYDHIFNCGYFWDRNLERYAIHISKRCLITGD